MFKLVQDRSQKGKKLSHTMMLALQDMMNDNENIVMLDADCGNASGSLMLQKSHPDQFIECGISEANMIGVAAGMSSMGYVPYVHTFSPFASRRVFDQVYLSGAYAYNTINIYGSDPGFTTAHNGGTHTAFEDMAMMREIPGALVMDVADEVQMDWIIRNLPELTGVHYFRATRGNARNVYQPGSTFTFGKGNVLKEGKDVLIITCGQIVSDALDAAETLERQGVSCEVIDMFCVKPLDVDLILSEVQDKKAVVTFENHSIYGGLGSAVSEVLAENRIAIPFKRHGVQDRFGQVGSAQWLQQEFELTAEDLIKTIQSLLK